MFEIGIIEDQLTDQEDLKNKLIKFSFKKNIETKTHTFKSYEEIEKYITNDVSKLQIVFIDIQLQNDNGIEIARWIRSQSISMKIVFVSAFPEYVFDTFVVHPEFFLKKPVNFNELSQILNTIIIDSIKNIGKGIVVKDVMTGSMIRIDFDEVMSMVMINSDKRLLEITTMERKTYIHSRLDQFSFLLNGDTPFFKTYRNTLVNVLFIRKINHQDIILLNGNKVALSRTKKAEVLKKFILFDKGKV